MKRTLERVLFMLIGAMLVGIAYFLGSADQHATAEGVTRFEEVEITGDLTVAGTVAIRYLIVRDQVVVGDLTAYPKNMIAIKATADIPAIALYNNVRDIAIDDSDSSVFILAGEHGDGNPVAAIKLKDKFGNEIKGISNAGWSDR